MSKIISVIPNICEGKDQKFIDDLTLKLNNVAGLVLLDVSMDKSRNRTVFAFTGSREAIFSGGLVLYEESLKHIDMRHHQGEYPRIGAVDVFPFVPLKDVSIEESVALSIDFARQVAETFRLPVYLFSESAQFPLRKDIENIRQGEYEGLEEKLKDPRWKPDFGPEIFKPDTGATIIGARHPMVSFKLFLSTADIELTKAVSRSIQQKWGGFQFVKAYSGIDAESQETHLTVSITNYRATPMYRVLEMVRMEGRRYNIKVKKVEMIGLVPEIALIESALYYMKVKDFSFDRLLEKNIQQHLDEKFFLD